MTCSELAEAMQRRKSHDWPEFWSIAQGLISAMMAGLEGGDSKSFEGEPDRHKILSPLTESNIVGSEIDPSLTKGNFIVPLYKPVLDIDLPIWAKESSTEGHWHLIIDKPMPWEDYQKLLDVMLDVGILEEGFVKAAKSRGASWIRVPWVKKEIEA